MEVEGIGGSGGATNRDTPAAPPESILLQQLERLGGDLAAHHRGDGDRAGCCRPGRRGCVLQPEVEAAHTDRQARGLRPEDHRCGSTAGDRLVPGEGDQVVGRAVLGSAPHSPLVAATLERRRVDADVVGIGRDRDSVGGGRGSTPLIAPTDPALRKQLERTTRVRNDHRALTQERF